MIPENAHGVKQMLAFKLPLSGKVGTMQMSPFSSEWVAVQAGAFKPSAAITLGV